MEAKQRTYKRPRASLQSLRDESKMVDSLPGEEWELEAQARLSVKLAGFPAGGAPGFVSVSNLRVVFEPAKTSVTRATADIRMADIERVWRTWNLPVFPNSLKILTKTGTCHNLTTWSRNAIVDLVTQQISSSKT
jgi:hypothetical protein